MTTGTLCSVSKGLFSAVEVPPNAGKLIGTPKNTHDLAMYILEVSTLVAAILDIDHHENFQKPVKFSSSIRPICLPNQVLDFFKSSVNFFQIRC